MTTATLDQPAAPVKESVPAAKKVPRQWRAARLVAVLVSALFMFTVISAGTEIAIHGFGFFVFREAGAGETGGSSTDQSFLAQQSADQHMKTTAIHHR